VSKSSITVKRVASARSESGRGKSKNGSADNDYIHTIGDLAQEFGVTLRTLRFYEDRGLIKPKRQGLTRLYSDASKSRLKEILKAVNLGFTLTEIRALLGVDGSSKASAVLKLSKTQIAEQLAHLEKQRTEIDKAIAELKSMQKMAA
jgi:DNA-binding transcriptional MerR regulator